MDKLKHLKLWENYTSDGYNNDNGIDDNEENIPKIELRFSCENAFFNYLKDRDLEKLEQTLLNIENFARKKYNGSSDEGIWFKFSKDDTMATTIKDIIKDLYLPPTHNNYKFMVENLEKAVSGLQHDSITGEMMSDELMVYFS